MHVYKVEKPIVALAFVATADGNNFNQLALETAQVNGTVQLVSDNIAQVTIDGRSYDIPINYVLVFDGSVRLLNVGQFNLAYVPVSDTAFDLDELLERIEKIETQLGELSDKQPVDKSKPAQQ